MDRMQKENEPGQGIYVSGTEDGRHQVAGPHLFLGCPDVRCGDSDPPGHVIQVDKSLIARGQVSAKQQTVCAEKVDLRNLRSGVQSRICGHDAEQQQADVTARGGTRHRNLE